MSRTLRWTLVAVALGGVAAAADQWKTARHSSEAFSFEHPAGWEAEESEEGWLAVCSPREGPCFFATPYRKPGGTLAEFAKMGFAAEAEKYKPRGKPRALEANGWSGLIQEGEGKAAEGDAQPTRRVVLCAGGDGLFVRMTLYTAPKDYEDNAALYDRIFRSLRLTP